MLDYWTSFATDGRPRSEGLPVWQPYGTRQNYLRFTDAPEPGRDFKPGMVELHDAFAARRRADGHSWGLRIGLSAADADEK